MQAGVHDIGDPPHLPLDRDNAHISNQGSRLTKRADIVLYAWRKDQNFIFDLVGVCPARMGL